MPFPDYAALQCGKFGPRMTEMGRSNPDFLLGDRTSASANCRHWSGRAVHWSSCSILLRSHRARVRWCAEDTFCQPAALLDCTTLTPAAGRCKILWSRDDLVQVVLDHEMTCWLRVSGLAFELLLPPPSFSASAVCAFQFIAFVHLVRSTGVIIVGHAKAPRKVHSQTRLAQILR